MKLILTLGACAALLASAGCATSKSYASCKQDVERLKDAVSETAFFLEALELELQAADEAVRACDAQVDTCTAELWVGRLQDIRLQTADERAQFVRANETWRAEACLDYTSTYRLNPPPPERYRAYYENYDNAERRIGELIAQFEALGG
ncbi:MAG: hypothetical protein RLN72_02505 [Henriciella sp.]